MIVMAVVLLIQCCWVYLVRDRIPMAAAMLEIASEVQSQFWGMYVCTVFMIIVAAAGISGWGYSAYSVLQTTDSTNENLAYGVGLFYMFSLFWIVNVFRYTVHSVGAGCTGVWYFQVS